MGKDELHTMSEEDSKGSTLGMKKSPLAMESFEIHIFSSSSDESPDALIISDSS